MPDLPPVVADHIHRLTVRPRSPAYLLVDRNGRITDCGGELEAYGLAGLQKGDAAADRACWLAGLLPLDEAERSLPCVETESGRPADLHIVRERESDWVLLLDATNSELQQRRMQQAANDLALLRERLSRALEGQLAGSLQGEGVREVPGIREGGKRLEAGVMAVRLHGFATVGDRDEPGAAFRTYTRSLRALAGVIRRGGGILGAISGESVVAYFGLLPSGLTPSAQAVEAAIGAVQAVREIPRPREDRQHAALSAGVGVASGEIAVGLVADTGPGTLGAFGLPVSRALELGGAAEPGELLVETDTYNASGERRRIFRARAGLPENIDEDLPIFSCKVEG